jgi:hypothetical protein
LRFATAADAIAALNDAFGPKAESGWRFDRPLLLCASAPGAPATIRTFRAATTTTMHFGRVTIDLATGETLFVDEDHRDGGDFELKRVTLPPEWLEALRAVLP